MHPPCILPYQKADADSKKLAFAPDAVQKLPDKAGALTSLYNNEISAILLHCYQVQMSDTNKKPALVEKLKAKILQNPDKLFA